MSNTRIDEQTVSVPGGHVFVRRWTPPGDSGGAPVVLLHDSLGSVALWRDFPHALACRLQRPVIAYDRLGFGQSSPRNGLPSLDFIAEEAEVFFPALRDALGLSEFALFGHSVGGAMALVIAATQPGCAWVVTEAAQAFVEARTLDGIRAARVQFAQPEAFARLQRWHGDRAQWVLDAWTQVWLSPAFTAWTLDAHLGQVGCPVLAIHGELDEYGTAAFPARIAAGVSGPCRQVLLEACGHVPHR